MGWGYAISCVWGLRRSAVMGTLVDDEDNDNQLCSGSNYFGKMYLLEFDSLFWDILHGTQQDTPTFENMALCYNYSMQPLQWSLFPS